MVAFLHSAGAPQEDAAATGVSTIAVPYPSPISPGDQLVLSVSQKASSGQLSTNPATWTNVKNLSELGNTLPTSTMVSIKTAVGTESGTLTVTKPVNVASWAQIVAFTGVDQLTPQDTAATQLDTNGTGATNMVLPGLTTTRPGAILVLSGSHLATAQNVNTQPTSPGTFTEDGDRISGVMCAYLGHLVWTGVGATGSVTLVWSGSARGVGVLLALRPAVSDQPAPANPAGRYRRSNLVR